MDGLDAIRNRRSTRAFLATPVTEAELRDILEVVRWAPSGGLLRVSPSTPSASQSLP